VRLMAKQKYARCAAIENPAIENPCATLWQWHGNGNAAPQFPRRPAAQPNLSPPSDPSAFLSPNPASSEECTNLIRRDVADLDIEAASGGRRPASDDEHEDDEEMPELPLNTPSLVAIIARMKHGYNRAHEASIRSDRVRRAAVRGWTQQTGILDMTPKEDAVGRC